PGNGAGESRLMSGFLNAIERAGNKLPEPALIFFYFLLVVMGLSAVALTNTLANMVTTFTTFAPLGIVLVAMLGVGVAESSGFINVGL
ncbi:AbgT family transporter, partial [Pseudocitrobacter faecalis]|uniref:AbgT family transporter n=1 Tax=Pseudocitrobacter faecalis TaxID=1398493 RepID=UPI00331571D5